MPAADLSNIVAILSIDSAPLQQIQSCLCFTDKELGHRAWFWLQTCSHQRLKNERIHILKNRLFHKILSGFGLKYLIGDHIPLPFRLFEQSIDRLGPAVVKKDPL